MNWLMATVIPPAASEEMVEAEPVLVKADQLTITLELDDGSRLVIDRGEFLAAIGQPALRKAA